MTVMIKAHRSIGGVNEFWLWTDFERIFDLWNLLKTYPGKSEK